MGSTYMGYEIDNSCVIQKAVHCVTACSKHHSKDFGLWLKESREVLQ